MTENINENELKTEKSEIVKNEQKPEAPEAAKPESFKFFKNCSASLKRFSVLIFAVNLFLIFIAAAIGVTLIAVYLGTDMLSLLAVPILTLAVILVVFARFISALIYGFSEIVENNERK